MLDSKYRHPLAAPSPFTALTASKEFIAAGSEDGTVRIYRANENRVFRAIRGLENEVSSLAFGLRSLTQGTLARIWIAAGQHLFCFDLNETKLVMLKEDAVLAKRILEDDKDEDNVLNEIAVNKSHIAFTCDSGFVGVYDLTSQDVRLLKSNHKNVSSPIAFIPNRPREVVSGGYDCALLHSDYLLGTYLSSIDFGGALPDDAQRQQTSLSPPFVHAMSLSSAGHIACGLADGRLWVGSGGAKTSSTANKKSKKWEGLDPEQGRFYDIATGPIVGVVWKDDTRVFTSTLSGVLKLHDISPTASEGGHATVVWEAKTSEIAKVNALDWSSNTDQALLAVAGVSPAGKGAIEIREFPSSGRATA